jgi:hypothetical protein
VKRALAAVGVVAGLALIGYAVFSGQSDEELIRARLVELEEALALDGQSSNPAAHGLRLRGKFANIFEKDVTATIPELGSTREGRDELAALAMHSGSYFETLDVDFENVDVGIDGTKLNARVKTLAVVTGTRRGEKQPRREERRVALRFFKGEENGWRIAVVRVGDAEEDLPDEE